jgi:hypothetical protein
VSGLIGGAVAVGLSFWMRGQRAEVFNGRVIARLIHEYRWHIRFCAAVFISSLFGAVAVYKLGWAASNDWRPLALGFGAGALVPLAIVYLVLPRQRFEEFWVAASAKEGVRPWVMRMIMILMAVFFAAGLAGYLWR